LAVLSDFLGGSAANRLAVVAAETAAPQSLLSAVEIVRQASGLQISSDSTNRGGWEFKIKKSKFKIRHRVHLQPSTFPTTPPTAYRIPHTALCSGLS
jgi:hypothetical protein